MKARTALVTGGAKRIGRAICLHLAAQGYRILIHYRHSDTHAAATRLDCLAAGATMAQTIACDLSDTSARSALIDRAVGVFGEVDLLVNSASMFEYDTASTFTPKCFDDHLQTNLIAPVQLTMDLHRRGRRAHVITLLDQKLLNLNTDYMSYTLTKLASHSTIRYLAQCCAPLLRVNAIAPGVSMVSGSMTEGEFEVAQKIAALGNSSTPDDIAAAVLMLDGSRAVTGQTLVVDGGQHLLPRSRDVAFAEM